MRNGNATKSIEVQSPAKVNLFLEILGKRPDGFHELETVMSTVSLYDSLRFRPRNDNSINLRVCPIDTGIPDNDQNLVVRALKLCRSWGDSKNNPRGMDVVLQKRIPAQGGLGGASGNAALTIQMANMLWELNLTESNKHEIAAQLGSDVPFFIQGGTAVCRGRGEKIESLDRMAGIPVVIVTPPEGLSTPAVFRTVEIPAQSVQSKWDPQRESGIQMFNRLEQFATKLTAWIDRIKLHFNLAGCVGHQLSGSGSSYFGIFREFNSARIAARLLKARLPTSQVFCVRTTGRFAQAKPIGATT